MRILRTLAAAALVAAAWPASAELIEKQGRFGGLDLTYKVLLPPHYDAAREYPAVLVFTGGPQTLAMAENTVNVDWRDEAEKRSYIVISPATPNGELFFEGADRVFPEFLDALLRDYKVANAKLHVAGHSNGGLSAFHVAAMHPEYFSTVTGYPGLLNDASSETRLPSLKPTCIFMHVGEQDSMWMAAMRRQADELEEERYRVAFTVEPRQAHRLRAPEIGLSARLFDEIENCK
jgi:poly(3-hydroxybutyrate) depolymerase